MPVVKKPTKLAHKRTTHTGLKCTHLTIMREGTVQLSVEGGNHCAVQSAVGADGRVAVKWRLFGKFENKVDPSGFLFDQSQAADWVAELVSTPRSESCEKLAEYLAEEIMRRIHEDYPMVVLDAFKMQLSPAPFSSELTAEYGEW